MAQEENRTNGGWLSGLHSNPVVQMFTLTRWSLLKDQRFLLTMLGTSIAFTAMMNFFMFLPVHAKAHGIAMDKVATLVSINNSLSLATIMLYSWLGGQPGKSRNDT